LNNGKELISFFDLDLWSHTNSRRKLISSATYRCRRQLQLMLEYIWVNIKWCV
jgi:hypothetical protein